MTAGHPRKVAPVADVREGRGLCVVVDGREIALFRCGNEIVAIDNSCAHQHFAVLHQGEVKDCIVECPMHGWRYDLHTGKSLTGQGRVAVHHVTIHQGDVYITIDDGW